MIWGLTGYVAAGKSTVSSFLNDKFNAYIFDCDKLCHNVLNTYKDEVNKAIGFELNIPDAEIRRQVISELIFADKAKKERLERLIWNKLEEELKKQIEVHKSGIMVVDAPLLFQSSFDSYTDRNLFITADETLRCSRFVKRGGNAEKFENINKSQKSYFESNTEKLKKCMIIENNGSLDELKKSVSLFMNK